MAFFLLKWVFNAIKRDSEPNDTKLAGKQYVQKQELIKQLSKNQEILSAMNYTSIKKLEEDVKFATGAKDGCLTWSEFLDFFFLKDVSFQDRIGKTNDWWNKIDPNGKGIEVKGSTPPRSNRALSETSQGQSD